MKIFNFIVIVLVFTINQDLLSQNNNIKVVTKRNSDKSVDITYTKELPGSYFIKLEFGTIENSYQSDIEKVIKYDSGKLVTLKPTNENEHINFSYTVYSVRGYPNPKVDKKFNYSLPFKKGKTIKILETTNLKETYFDANKDKSWKSFVVDRTYADTVYNMRKGIITEIKAKYDTNPIDAFVYTSNMNRITVEHKDGTISRYTGFNKKSIFVKLGQTVYPQTELGVLDKFNNSVYRLYFDVAFLKEYEFNPDKKNTVHSENQMEHVNPYFYSNDGPIVLKHDVSYKVEFNESVLLKEFSKREKKKYKKNPKLFE